MMQLVRILSKAKRWLVPFRFGEKVVVSARGALGIDGVGAIIIYNTS
jgi:hypothetical protein